MNELENNPAKLSGVVFPSQGFQAVTLLEWSALVIRNRIIHNINL